MRELRCATCAFSLYDVAPSLPFLPNKEIEQVAVIACCWRCGARFNVSGKGIRERQIRALFSSINPARVYTDERARAVHAYVFRLYMVSEELAAQKDKDESLNHHERYQKREAEREMKKKRQAAMSAKAKARLILYERVIVETNTEHERLRKQLGDLPNDMTDKTFAELETLIFGDASDESHALDAKAARLEDDKAQV